MLLLHGDHSTGFTLFGYDLPRIHAALNDLPAALLLTAILLELLYLVRHRESFRAASYWTLVFGTIGTGLAVGSGLLAEDIAAHSGAAHKLMEDHRTWGLVTLAVFVVVAGWRLWREKIMGRGERWALLVLAIFGSSILIRTAQHGGSLVFDHATGISTGVLKEEIEQRAKGDHDDDGDADEHQHGDSTDAHEHDAH